MVEAKEVQGKFSVLFATSASPPDMREQIQARLEALRQELEKGQAELQKVEAQRKYVHEMVLQISGAVQVLEEVLAEGESLASQSAPHEQPSAAAKGNGTNA